MRTSATLPSQNSLHAAQRVAGVGDVVGDQDPGVGDVDEVGRRRQDPRHLEALVDAGVELDVHRVDVLHRQGVAERAADQQPAAGDGQDHVRLVAVVGDHLGQAAGRLPEQLPRQDLALARHRSIAPRRRRAGPNRPTLGQQRRCPTGGRARGRAVRADGVADRGDDRPASTRCTAARRRPWRRAAPAGRAPRSASATTSGMSSIVGSR